MSTKRLRRFSITTPSLTGCRDFDYRDLSEFDTTKSDIEGAGYPVRMSTGGFEVSFKCQYDAQATGYVASLVCVVVEATVAAGEESTVNKTYTFADGFLVKDLSVPTDNPGEIALRGTFRTMTPT